MRLNPQFYRDAGDPPPQPNSDLVRQREHIDELKKDLKALREEKDALIQKVTTFEREKMGEIERLNAEKGDLTRQLGELSSYRDSHGRFEEKFKGLFESEWASVPDDVKPKLEKLVVGADHGERYEKLLAAKALIPAPGNTNSPNPALPGNPGNPTPPNKTVDPAAVPSTRWGHVFGEPKA